MPDIEVTEVPFRCGATASITYPVEHPEVLARPRQWFRRELARRDCPACEQGLPNDVPAGDHVLHPEGEPGEDWRYWWIGREVARR
jgi:hypothetical protein